MQYAGAISTKTQLFLFIVTVVVFNNDQVYQISRGVSDTFYKGITFEHTNLQCLTLYRKRDIWIDVHVGLVWFQQYEMVFSKLAGGFLKFPVAIFWRDGDFPLQGKSKCQQKIATPNFASKQNSGAPKKFEIVKFCIFDMKFIFGILLWSNTQH